MIVVAKPGWTEETRGLVPGTHLAVLADAAEVGIEGRLVGLELRDTLLVLRPGPTSSFCFLFRQPIAQSTVADQMATTATGVLNVERCRVGEIGGTKRGSQVPYPKKADGREDRSQSWARTGHDIVELKGGRWPPNVVLVHGPGCHRRGVKQVRASNPTGQAASKDKPRVRGIYMEDDPNAFRDNGARTFYGEGGLEKVLAWECEMGCSIRLLDEKSGERKAGGGIATSLQGPAAGKYHGHGSGREPWEGYGDEGGASRFFPQFSDEAELGAWLSGLITGPTLGIIHMVSTV